MRLLWLKLRLRSLTLSVGVYELLIAAREAEPPTLEGQLRMAQAKRDELLDAWPTR